MPPPLRPPQSGSRPGCALPYLEKWCKEQAELMFPDPHGRRRFPVARQIFMLDDLMWAICDVFLMASTSDEFDLTEQGLLKYVPKLKDWKYHEKHITALCSFLNSISMQVYIDWPVAQANMAALKKAEEDAIASAQLTPAELRKRVLGLEQVIELMASTFSECQKISASAKLSDSQRKDLAEKTKRFEILMRCGTSPRDTPIQQLMTYNLLPKRPESLLTLPSEVRNRIYDKIVKDMYPYSPCSRDRACIDTHWDGLRGSSQELLVFPIAQVSKQVRSEFLPRWHQIIELAFDPDPDLDNNMTDNWLKLFGAFRIPLARSFRFQFGDDCVRVELQGAPSRAGFGDSTFRVEWIGGSLFSASVQPIVGGVAQIERVRVSSPPAWIEKVHEARQRRELEFESKLQNFVNELLVDGGDGSVHLTTEGVIKIMKYLKRRQSRKRKEYYGA